MRLSEKSNENTLEELAWNLVIPKLTANEKDHLKYIYTSGIGFHWGILQLPSSDAWSSKTVSTDYSAPGSMKQ